MLRFTLTLSYGLCTASRGCFLFVAEPVKRGFRFCKLTPSLHHAACGLYTGKGGEVGGPSLPPPEPCIPSLHFFLGFFSNLAKYQTLLSTFPLFLPLPTLVELPAPAISPLSSRTFLTPYAPSLAPRCNPHMYSSMIVDASKLKITVPVTTSL